MKKAYFASATIAVVLIAAIYGYYVSTSQPAVSHDSAIPAGYIAFSNDTYDAIPAGKTSVVLIPSSPLHLQFTLFSPDDPQDSRLEITNMTTGAQCDTQSYLIEHVYVSGDETHALLYTYSGSNRYADTIDTATCKATEPTQALP
jgi:hypothetical protein